MWFIRALHQFFKPTPVDKVLPTSKARQQRLHAPGCAPTSSCIPPRPWGLMEWGGGTHTFQLVRQKYITIWQKTNFFTFRGKKSYSPQFREIKQVSCMLLKHTRKATVFSWHPLTGIPRSWGSTGCRKGKDSGSCRYRASRVDIRAWRNSSGLKTVLENTGNDTVDKAPRLLLQSFSMEAGLLLRRPESPSSWPWALSQATIQGFWEQSH